MIVFESKIEFTTYYKIDNSDIEEWKECWVSLCIKDVPIIAIVFRASHSVK